MTIFSSPMPAPLLMARWMASFVTLSFLAFSTAVNSRAFIAGSAPPILAATEISRTSLPVVRPFLRPATNRLACSHWRPIGGQVSRCSGENSILLCAGKNYFSARHPHAQQQRRNSQAGADGADGEHHAQGVLHGGDERFRGVYGVHRG